VSLAVRTWLRYVVPLTILSAIALAPILWIALTTSPPADLVRARHQIRVAWLLAACAWTCQLWFVAAVAPTVRAVADGRPVTQLRALVGGIASLLRGIVPCAIAICAIVIGSLALVAPGVMLLVLLSLTGASEQLDAPLPAPLADSIAVAREQLTRITLVVLAIIVADVAIAYAAQLALVPAIAKKVGPAKLVPIRTFVRTVALALVAVSPVAACALASASARFRAR